MQEVQFWGLKTRKFSIRAQKFVFHIYIKVSQKPNELLATFPFLPKAKAIIPAPQLFYNRSSIFRPEMRATCARPAFQNPRVSYNNNMPIRTKLKGLYPIAGPLINQQTNLFPIFSRSRIQLPLLLEAHRLSHSIPREDH